MQDQMATADYLPLYYSAGDDQLTRCVVNAHRSIVSGLQASQERRISMFLAVIYVRVMVFRKPDDD